MKDEIVEPKDLGIIMGTKSCALWTKVRDSQEQSLLNSEIDMEIAKKVIALAKLKIKEEEEKFKKIGKKKPIGVG